MTVLDTIRRAQAAQRAYYRRTHIQLALDEEEPMPENQTAAVTETEPTDYHLDSRFSNLEYTALCALTALHDFWTNAYGPNEALTPAFDALESMRETWEGSA